MITVHEGSHKSFLPNAIRSRIAAIGAGMSFRWSDVFDAPLHDFPIRDEILCQYLPLAAGADVLEVGPGSGFTAFRLARRVRRVTLLDVAPQTIDELRTTLKNIPNIQFVCADVTASDLPGRLGHAFELGFCENRELFRRHEVFGNGEPLHACVERDPSDAWALRELALIALQRGDLAGAREHAQSASVVCPHSAEQIAVDGLVLRRAG